MHLTKNVNNVIKHALHVRTMVKLGMRNDVFFVQQVFPLVSKINVCQHVVQEHFQLILRISVIYVTIIVTLAIKKQLIVQVANKVQINLIYIKINVYKIAQ